MRRRRGFTLIEVTIVLVLLGIISLPFLQLVASMYREFTSLTMVASLKSECDQAGYDVLHLAAEGGAWHVDADNHGATLGRGHVHWQPGTLTVTESGRTRRVVLPHVDDCCLVRSGEVLVVSVSARGPLRPGGAPVETHASYQYPTLEGVK